MKFDDEIYNVAEKLFVAVICLIMVASKIYQTFIKFALQETGNTCDCFEFARSRFEAQFIPGSARGGDYIGAYEHF